MPRFRVIGRILRDGQEFVPGDSINVSHKQAKQWYLEQDYCIEITDRKLLQEIEDEKIAMFEQRRRDKLYDEADKHGVDREVVDRGLLN